MEGFQPHLFSDGEQVLEHLLSEPFDAAILDADLAKVSGFDVCQRVRELTVTPVVLLLMRGEPRQQAHGRQVGAAAFLFIPFDVDELLDCINAALPNGETSTTEHA